MIEVKELVKQYGTHTAVDHLSFTVETGKIYGFLGPNGAGKSTTMNMMTGYLGATKGEILIEGYDILKNPKKAKKHIGYLPEIPPLYVDMKVKEYLTFAAKLKGIPKKEVSHSVEEVMEKTGILDVSHRLIRNLSKGFRQRVGLAQAILGFPKIIILDEPTVGLDPKQIIEIRELIRDLSKEHTVILSSHILAEVRELCDYIFIISKGKMVASDTPENLERLMQKGESVEIFTTSQRARVEDILLEIEDVESVSFEEREDGTCARIEAKEGKDIREEIFFAFAGERCPLLELRMTKPTLEDVFLELTEGGKDNGGDL
ncbi:ABC transporter ATP-binding protein [Lachnoclostridium sp. An181]|uniref:ABC transporter ATP-binding protein n=1 Tax=Lachnoclostridium sp. An181 TaxID=1965575 RepID=UPI000B398B2E|nr:ABC transporter [Lachnoclostridium sp. An181]